MGMYWTVSRRRVPLGPLRLTHCLPCGASAYSQHHVLTPLRCACEQHIVPGTGDTLYSPQEAETGYLSHRKDPLSRMTFWIIFLQSNCSLCCDELGYNWLLSAIIGTTGQLCAVDRQSVIAVIDDARIIFHKKKQHIM